MADMDDEMRANDEEEVEEEEDAGSTEKGENEVYLPGDPMQEDEELTFDKTAYDMYHEAQSGAPCLSFDIIPDDLGAQRTEYPMTCYMIGGTQAERANQNSLIVMKMSNLEKTSSDSDSEDSYVEDENDGPVLHTVSCKHIGGVNRVRHAPITGRNLVSTWADTGKVHIYDISTPLTMVNVAESARHQTADVLKPIYSFSGHQDEGFAMDWSAKSPGRLATGSCNAKIHLWQLRDDGTFHVDQRPYNAHEKSVEDIQWSPNEANVFASCSVDQSIRIWDARRGGKAACMLTVHAHDADVNVISWNKNDPFILSGGDDGVLKVWDLRQFQNGVAVATFKHHTAPITSVEWHCTDSTIFAASGAENQLTLWDLAVERDNESEAVGRMKDIPPQLLFIHMGQTDIKELHWHPQLPGVIISTAASGYNIFKTISV